MEGPFELQVKLLRPGARLPARQSDLASGFDLHACLDGGTLEVGGMPVLVPTGVAIAAPPGTDVQIRPRSGLSSRGVMSTFGTIDADYRGELFVTMYCLPSVGSYVIEDGERIAQLVVSRLAEVRWIVVQALDETSRGASGHGSTGRG
ncbi:MAG TPA: dUTP diphosphatase [Dehalococcoidia bacterium]|nr:dUTP diphosphatase [Dehalococcoidia bacterium]